MLRNAYIFALILQNGCILKDAKVDMYILKICVLKQRNLTATMEVTSQ